MAAKKSGIYRSLTIIGILLLFLLMLASFSVYLFPHFGWRIDFLASGSMEPQLKVGDLIVTRPVEPKAIVVGDIIAFYPTDLHENLVSHRVIGIEKNPALSFQTKGDANETSDPFIIPARNLVGRVSFHTRYLGYIARFLKTPLGFTCGMVIPALIILGACVNSLRFELVKKLRENGNRYHTIQKR